MCNQCGQNLSGDQPVWAEPTHQSVGTNQCGQNLRANQWGPTSVGRTYVPISGDQPVWAEPTCQSVGTNQCGQKLRANQWGPTSVGRTYVPISGDQPVWAEPIQTYACIYCRTSVQRNSLSRTSWLAGRWLDWTSGCRGQKYCIAKN